MNKKTSAEYVRDNYDRIMLNLKKGSKDKLKELARKDGLSLTAYIRKIISERCEL